LREAGIVLIAPDTLTATSDIKMHMLRSGEGERNKEGGTSLHFEMEQSKDKITEA
jgi:hypothetical protein